MVIRFILHRIRTFTALKGFVDSECNWSSLGGLHLMCTSVLWGREHLLTSCQAGSEGCRFLYLSYLPNWRDHHNHTETQFTNVCTYIHAHSLRTTQTIWSVVTYPHHTARLWSSSKEPYLPLCLHLLSTKIFFADSPPIFTVFLFEGVNLSSYFCIFYFKWKQQAHPPLLLFLFCLSSLPGFGWLRGSGWLRQGGVLYSPQTCALCSVSILLSRTEWITQL